MHLDLPQELWNWSRPWPGLHMHVLTKSTAAKAEPITTTGTPTVPLTELVDVMPRKGLLWQVLLLPSYLNMTLTSNFLLSADLFS